jgi:hypothetical protein
MKQTESRRRQLAAPAHVDSSPFWTMHRNNLFAILAGVILLSACGAAEARQDDTSSGAAREAERARLRATPGYVVDTIHPMDTLLARFRQGLTPPPDMELQNGSSSRDQLVQRFLRAMQDGDTLSLEKMQIDSAEFAWIYFPGSPYSAAPYELPPDYVWFHTRAESGKGLQRARRAMQGKRITFHGYSCNEEAERYGEALIWTGCQLRWTDADGKAWDFRMFGSIMEHRGQFKLVSYANKL